MSIPSDGNHFEYTAFTSGYHCSGGSMFSTKTHGTSGINTHARIHISAFGKDSCANTASFSILGKLARIYYRFCFLVKLVKSHTCQSFLQPYDIRNGDSPPRFKGGVWERFSTPTTVEAAREMKSPPNCDNQLRQKP